jgi:hypothetical protein
MENENQTQNENFENQLTSAAVGFLQESAKWSGSERPSEDSQEDLSAQVCGWENKICSASQ